MARRPDGAFCSGCVLQGLGSGFARTDGKGTSGVLVVAEALGAEEAAAGRPLVGKAGQLFNRMVGRTTDPSTGEPFRRDDFLLANVINCFPGNTTVEAAGVQKAYRRWYEGTLLTLRTPDGFLPGTPNHPVLTSRGWLRLKDIQVGDYLVRGTFSERVSRGDPYVYCGPTLFSQAFKALANSGVGMGVVGSNVDFHGDGGEADVDVVTSDRLLWSRAKASGLEGLAEHSFESPHYPSSNLEAQCSTSGPTQPLFHRPLTSSNCLVGCPGESRSVLWASEPKAEGLSLTGTSEGDEVGFSKVLDVEESWFSGHVYNLQTESAHYITNGFIVHNCQPPGNELKDAWYETQAIARCSPYLRETIEKFKPKAILAMGNTPLQWLTGFSGISGWRGYVVGTPHGLVVPTYHPSYIQRGNMRLAKVFMHDLRKAVHIAREGHTIAPVDYLIRPTPQQAEAWLEGYLRALAVDPSLVLAFDIETPYSSALDEDAASEDDDSYVIERVSLSYQERTGISMPWMAPFTDIARKALATPNPKTVWNCPTPDQRILTADLRWVPAGDLKVGDALVGFDEEPQEGRKTRRYKRATVTRTARQLDEVFSVRFKGGLVVKVTGDHKWLLTGKRRGWVPTSSLRPGSQMRRAFSSWNTGESRAHGWLAGFFDGEGSLSKSVNPCGDSSLVLQVSQKVGPTLDRAISAIRALGYNAKVYRADKQGYSPIGTGVIRGGKSEVCRFLGEVRPQRLLDKVSPEDLGSVWHNTQHEVEEVISLGVQEVVAIATTTSTYVLEGFGAHNCAFDEPRLVYNNAPVHGRIYDAMWAWHLAQPEWPYGLKYAATFYTDIPQWKHLSNSAPEYYSVVDADALLRCFNGVRRDLNRTAQWETYERHVVDLAAVLRRMSARGVLVSLEKRAEERKRFKERYEILVGELTSMVPRELLPRHPKEGYKKTEEQLRKVGLWQEGRMFVVGAIIVPDPKPPKEPKPRRARKGTTPVETDGAVTGVPPAGRRRKRKESGKPSTPPEQGSEGILDNSSETTSLPSASGF